MHKSNYINAVTIDRKGNKWVATASHLRANEEGIDVIYGGAGLLKFDNINWTAYTSENAPLPSNKINWVRVDNNDNVWFHQFQDVYVDGFWGVFNENGLPPFLAPPTSAEEQPEATEGGITIYPNPTNTSFNISGAENILSVKLMNIFAMESSRTSSVVSGTSLVVSDSVEVDVADLVSGVYFVQLRTSAGMITKSIVVQ